MPTESTGQEPDNSTPAPPAPGTNPSAPGTTPPATGPADAGTGAEDRRPPWERTGEPFDPARAWQLIERLRGERDGARRDDPPRTPAPPPPTPPQRIPDNTAGSAPGGVQRQLDGLRSELTRERVARRYGLDDDLVELLGDGDEQAITARAKTLADRLGQTNAPAAGSPVPRRPVEQLRGGADPTTPAEETDPAKLAAQVRRSF